MVPDPERRSRRRWRKFRRQRAALGKLLKSINPADVTFEKAVSANLIVLPFCCNYLSFPIDIDPETWSVRSNDSNRRFAGFCFILSLVVFKAAAGILSFALGTYFERIDYSSIFPTFGIVVLVEHIIASTWGYTELVSDRVTFTSMLRAAIENRGIVTKKRIAHIFIWVLPLSMLVTLQAGNVIMSIDPRWITNARHQVNLVFELLGAETSGWAYIGVTAFALVVDTVAFFGVHGMATLFAFANLSFIEVWTDKVIILLEKWKTSRPPDFEALWKETMVETVFLRFFNQSCNYGVLAVKFGSMIMAILCISLLLISEMDLLTAYAIAFNGVMGWVGYLLVYQKGYFVKSLMDDLKLTLAEQAAKYNDPILARRALSLHSTGIWVGRFRIIEREFMLDYSDFVVNQIISIVLAANE